MRVREEYEIDGVNIIDGAIIFKDIEDMEQIIKNLQQYYDDIREDKRTKKPYVLATFKQKILDEFGFEKEDFYDILDEIGEQSEIEG